MFDTIIKKVRVVRPNSNETPLLDIGIKDGMFAAVERYLDPAEAYTVVDGNEWLAFPGAIDSHTHIGIYQHPSIDAPTESAAAVSGGVTTLLTYVRTGSLYLNRSGPCGDFMDELLHVSSGRFYCDYGYHVSPISSDHIAEMERIVCAYGAPNFGEVFMFYGLHGLHGRSDTQAQWLMLKEGDHYDLAHFDCICREAARLQRAYPELAPLIQVSFHCETPEILRAYEKKIRHEDHLQGLAAYSAARPPHSEAIAISIVGAMAHAAGLRHVNILHISSREAMEATLRCRSAYPDVDFGIEVTAGHLLLDTDCPMGVWAKVNPPIRPREDVEYLWEKVLDGTVQWVVTDHANCPRDMKVAATDPGNIWLAKAGFGGSEYLLPALYSEGVRRGLSPNRVAALVSGNPARRFGLSRKGDIAAGYDADLALLDPSERWTIHAANSFSAQGYTPFEGIELTGRVKYTFVRGQTVFANGQIVGAPEGRYLHRPMRG
ncbi:MULTISPECIES: dihydroorotase family protein [Roseiflexus]|uniref:Dihydropyrimidinase n=1 Tax=Roseiflexus castenholzii (strain DSM 13941 / HLO8) TaxID=383372 RepID=A7NPS3_ROSCS|nr:MULTISPECIES: dihydroorotase family protein [Roseiflexus]ABU59569.1 Dihydropyrimidinase [Roseiflexus castenholzii DSM 13941]GIW02671.1 MAG: dihydroorotase-like protein [Roseiflexus sp.]